MTDPTPSLNPDQAEALRRAGVRLGPPATWREALEQQQAAITALRRERETIELETLRGERLPIDRVRLWTGTVLARLGHRLAALPALADQLPDATPDQRAWLRSELKRWAEDTKTALREGRDREAA